jgi:hypothetical protein
LNKFVEGTAIVSRLVKQTLANGMVRHVYVAYMFDVRNYGFSTREKAMDEPAKENRPLAHLEFQDRQQMPLGALFLWVR